MVITDVRHQERAKRAKRKMVETCNQHRTKQYLHIIIEWSEDEVWEYIRKYHVPYYKLYDEGFKRLGCVMCLYGVPSHMLEEAARWPKIAKCYERAFPRMIDKRPCRWYENAMGDRSRGYEVVDGARQPTQGR